MLASDPSAAVLPLKVARLEQRCNILQQSVAFHNEEMEAMSSCLVKMLRMVLTFVVDVKTELARPGPGSPHRPGAADGGDEEGDSILRDYLAAPPEQRAEQACIATGQVETTLRSLFPFLLRCVRSSVETTSYPKPTGSPNDQGSSPSQKAGAVGDATNTQGSPVDAQTSTSLVTSGLLSDQQVCSIMENIEYDRRMKLVVRMFSDFLRKIIGESCRRHEIREKAIGDVLQPPPLQQEQQLNTTLSPVIWQDDVDAQTHTESMGHSVRVLDHSPVFTVPPPLHSAFPRRGSDNGGASGDNVRPTAHHDRVDMDLSDVDPPVASSADVSLESIGHRTATAAAATAAPPTREDVSYWAHAAANRLGSPIRNHTRSEEDDTGSVSSLSGSSRNSHDALNSTRCGTAASPQRHDQRLVNSFHPHEAGHGTKSFLMPIRQIAFGFDVVEYKEVVDDEPEIIEVDTLRIVSLHVGSPAERCGGLRVGDRLVKIDAYTTATHRDIEAAAYALSLLPAGTPVSVHVIRRRAPIIVSFVPEALGGMHQSPAHHTAPSPARKVSPVRQPVRRDLLGTFQLSSPSHKGTTSPQRGSRVSPLGSSYAQDRPVLDAIMDTSKQHVVYHNESMARRLQETLGRLQLLSSRREAVAFEKGSIQRLHSNGRSVTPQSQRSDISANHSRSGSALDDAESWSRLQHRVPRHLRASEHVHGWSADRQRSPMSSRTSSPQQHGRRHSPWK